MEYGMVLREAWRVAWRHKYLWLLGALAAEAGGFSMSAGVSVPKSFGWNLPKAIGTTFFSAYWTIAWRKLDALQPEHVRVSP